MHRRGILDRWLRFVVPVTVLGILKVVGLLMLHLYFRASDAIPAKINVLGLADGFPTRFPGLYLLTNWDSAWYLLIARYGYTEIPRNVRGIPSDYFLLSFNFFPGYPASIRILNFFLQDWILSASVISIVAGLCSVVIWQSISEDYTTKRNALAATLITFLFPPVFFITTIAYSESLYLLMALGSWRFLSRQKLWKASVLAGLASVIRPYGIVTMLPICLRAWKQRQWKNWAVVATSLIPMASWLAYGYEQTSSLLAFLYARSVGWGYAPTTMSLVAQFLEGKTVTSLRETWPFLTLLDVFTIVFLSAVFCLFCYLAIKRDKELGIYGFVQYFIVVIFGDWTTLMRLLSTIFPAWTVFCRKWRKWQAPVFLLIVISFYSGAMYLWQQFLIGGRAP
jgi:hypothetical protein